ncbi:diaminopimelate epimerase [Cytophaga hutchinsonii]|uniref:Diaminopimelate epimerase n=1 Tax=Cytophaga hutchinsonii (strain ATCC 33406 / DSM 1761 / CIP 103989 / NBRC 15051 / NCIMB 9469 / D465) TaxID=269798 RepID=A0A6N4SMC2_CYTH3|nr:diaminopimelate epimerase [Cytophaga hutchinsonii]ABG57420.1 diaminopimelate epimerase [Cytophaga hutchinsonii ATCC 33406]SFX97847.1 diaminopimelate epimerase [Cytophaga hutchinsonii ATCC 33406]
MKIPFYKYQGTGNDFIIIDNRSNIFDRERRDIVAQLCDRRFGIGADGFILLQNKEGYDFEMVYYNADGNESTMCGNGGRCIVQFAQDIGVMNLTTHFLAVDGVHYAFIKEKLVNLQMMNVAGIDTLADDTFFLNTGSPHYVKKVEKIEQFPVFETGKSIRYSDTFAPGGTNVNFMEMQDNWLFVRTYERGVENETYSCGTGVTAAAIAAEKLGIAPQYVLIKTLGGELEVTFIKKSDGSYKDVFLIGPAKRVFTGEIEVDF